MEFEVPSPMAAGYAAAARKLTTFRSVIYGAVSTNLLTSSMSACHCAIVIVTFCLTSGEYSWPWGSATALVEAAMQRAAGRRVEKCMVVVGESESILYFVRTFVGALSYVILKYVQFGKNKLFHENFPLPAGYISDMKIPGRYLLVQYASWRL